VVADRQAPRTQSPDKQVRRRPGRPRTGHLQRGASGWRARLTVTVDGERVQKVFDLGTLSRYAAKLRLARLLVETEDGALPGASRPETFAEAAERVLGSGGRGDAQAMARLSKWAFPEFGSLPIDKVTRTLVCDALDACRDDGRAKQTCAHLRQDVANVFKALEREDAVSSNPAHGASLPEYPREVRKQRAVLTDDELLRYLSWTHPDPAQQGGVLERQTMSAVSRMFGGSRAGDLHCLTWADLNPPDFEVGWSLRRKEAAPQRLVIPELLRPILRNWWERHGRPAEGLVFPVRRGDRAGEEKIGVSHAAALRRDLRRAFGIDVPTRHDKVRANGRPLNTWTWTQARPLTPREVELLEGGKYTRPVDFHSWRRAYAQALAEAGVNIHAAMALTGHRSIGVHCLYLNNPLRAKAMPEAALPMWQEKTATEGA